MHPAKILLTSRDLYRTFWDTLVNRIWVFSVLEMVNFSNTIDYLATQMKNKTSFKKHNNERSIIIAGIKELEWESVPFGVAG